MRGALKIPKQIIGGDKRKNEKKMTAWNPAEYLFEYELITYDDTDVE
jgi:hypothetical protein